MIKYKCDVNPKVFLTPNETKCTFLSFDKNVRSLFVHFVSLESTDSNGLHHGMELTFFVRGFVPRTFCLCASNVKMPRRGE